MKTRNILAILLGLGLLLATFVRSNAQGRPAGQADPQPPPRAAAQDMVITYQGRLTDEKGVPLNQPVNVVFRLYNSSDVLQWTSATRTITPVNGLFTVYLGESPDPSMGSYPFKSVGVTVGSDPEMTPRQPFNSLVGFSETNAAVRGSSASGVGLWGSGTSGIGVQGTSETATGVVAFNLSSSAPALSAENANGGPAITIRGGVKVPVAGVDTTTPVFMHKVDTSASGNLCPGSNHITVISNPMTDGRPGAILIVTPNYRASDGSLSNAAGPAKDIPAVSYLVGGLCGAANINKWVIYNLNATPMVNNTYYNVMVIWP